MTMVNSFTTNNNINNYYYSYDNTRKQATKRNCQQLSHPTSQQQHPRDANRTVLKVHLIHTQATLPLLVPFVSRFGPAVRRYI